MATVPTTAELLAEARAAYHNLVTGQAARVVVDANGERVEFTAAKRQDLYQYIQSLEKMLSPSAPCRTSGPAGFLF